MPGAAAFRQSNLWRNGWPERLISALAFAGLLAAVLIGFHPQLRENAGSDFKTLYASAWCFARGISGYDFHEIAHVFRLHGVIEPRSWYGHSPVYPPFTLALLAPLTALPMVVAIRLWIVLSAICMASATTSLARAADRVFHLGLSWRILLIGLIAGSPLISLGLELGNVSVVTVSLCILAISAQPGTSPWLRAGGLMIALLLKPHIAFWVVLSFVFSRIAADRKVLVRVCILGAGVVGVMAVWAFFQPVISQFAGYRAMVVSELSNGSMSPGNRDLMEIPVQMTSLSTLLGYWFARSIVMPFVSSCLLVLIAGGLAWTSWRLRSNEEASRFEVAAAWCAFGLMATYHRDADGTLLLFLLPLLFSYLRRSLSNSWAWATLAMLAAGSFGPSIQSLIWLAAQPGPYRELQFLWLRQGSLAMVCLALLFLAHLTIAARKRNFSESSEAQFSV